MIRVSNGACVRNLGWKSLKAARTRNLIAALAIALTTLLFSSLFTIALSFNEGFEQSNFRSAGGWAHGSFKNLTQEQFDTIKTDPILRAWGTRRFVGMPSEPPFQKTHVELSYMDENTAHWTYCEPTEGRLPAEGTNEAATDLQVLQLLGVEPKLGAEFTMTFSVDGRPTTQTFTLSGWWEYDPAVAASHVLMPESRVNAILQETGVTLPAKDGMTGGYTMDVMLKNAARIERDLMQVLENHGYQCEGPSDETPYVGIGVNWGYTGAQLAQQMDFSVMVTIVAALLLITFTGYLIIYNVFQISVINDIRFYGMLKTIGTTGKQIKRIVRMQALALCVIGVPAGLMLGWFVGAALVPMMVSQVNAVVSVVSVNPLIFVGAALFSVLTVLLSCAKPGRMAAKVSPVEAMRYTEGGGSKRKQKAGNRASVLAMAIANLGRSRGKTVVTILSMSLAVVLLMVTVTFVNGFDMDKYIAKHVASDFVLSHANYMQVSGEPFSERTEVPQEAIDAVTAQGGITAGGKVYGRTSAVMEFVTEEYWRNNLRAWSTEAEIERMMAFMQKNEAGLLENSAQIYGMEAFALQKLQVLEGDLSKLQEPGKRYLAAAFMQDDYGEPKPNSQWAKVGDTVTLRYVRESEYYNPDTDEVYDKDALPDDKPVASRAVVYEDIAYEVAALVMVPSALSYRYYGSDEFVMNDQTFLQDSGTDSVMLYAFDTADESTDAMQAFLADYTENGNPLLDYEGKFLYEQEFEGFRGMFLTLGGTLGMVMALVGVLNFFNAILTGIVARRREFAVLQSIGMTGRQLKCMLVYEGLFYTLGAIVTSLLITLAFTPVASATLESIFWFFTYQFTLMPIVVLTPLFVLLGCLVPLAVYRTVSKLTVVERLRQAEV